MLANLIQAQVGERRTAIYVIASTRDEHNGKERYYKRKTWAKVHINFKAVVNKLSESLAIMGE